MIRDAQLSILFGGLPAPAPDTAAGSVFSAVAIPFAVPHRIAKDQAGNPCILVHSQDAPRASPPPIMLQNLAVLHHVMCRITQPAGHCEQGLFTVLTCQSRDADTRDYFFWIAEHLIRAVGNDPSAAEVAEAVERLVELFRSLSRPAQSSIQGLWAEVLVIANARAPAEAIKFWRSIPQERYDFCAEGQRIEVKSTLSAVRAHHFSLDQLNPPPGVRALVASLLLARASSGHNVFDLVEQIRAGIEEDSAAIYKLQYTVGLTLGQDRQAAEDCRFDKDSALQSLCFFEASNVPSITPPIPREITEISFKADLTHAPTANTSQYTAEGGLFRAVIPPT